MKKTKSQAWKPEEHDQMLLEAVLELMPHKAAHGQKDAVWKQVEVLFSKEFTARTLQDHFKSLSAEYDVNEKRRKTTGNATKQSKNDEIMTVIREKEQSIDAKAHEPDAKVIWSLQQAGGGLILLQEKKKRASAEIIRAKAMKEATKVPTAPALQSDQRSDGAVKSEEQEG